MDYIIQEVMPGQIVVQYADDSRAIVGVSSINTPEEIDDLVSYYDPDFMPDPITETNPNVSIGEQRTSKRLPEEVFETFTIETPESENTLGTQYPETDIFNLNNVTFAAIHFLNKGDSSVMDALADIYDYVYDGVGSAPLVDYIAEVKANFIAKQNGELEPLDLSTSSEGSDEIFKLAMEELENE